MSRVIRNTGYVMLAAGGLLILASFAGFTMMESFDKLQVRDAWSYVAVAPGIATVLLGWFVTMYERYLDWVGPNLSSNIRSSLLP
jgi:cytochrome bd-type quinol oxidase subunit 1